MPIPLNHEQSQICSHIILSTVIPKGENHASVLQIFLLIIKWFLPETESVVPRSGLNKESDTFIYTQSCGIDESTPVAELEIKTHQIVSDSSQNWYAIRRFHSRF